MPEVLAETPDQCRALMLQNAAFLRRNNRETERQEHVTAQAEMVAHTAEIKLKDALDELFLSCEGSVAERQAKARIETRGLRSEFENAEAQARLERAKLDRFELVRRQVEREQMTLQSVLKSMMWEGA